MHPINFDTIACTLLSRFHHWEDLQAYITSDPDIMAYSSCVEHITSSRFEDVSPLQLLYFPNLVSCWPLVIRIRNEIDFARLLELERLQQAIIVFDNNFFEYVYRYLLAYNTRDTKRKYIHQVDDNEWEAVKDDEHTQPFFLFLELAPEGTRGISIFGDETYADFDFVRASESFDGHIKEVNDMLSLGLEHVWPPKGQGAVFEDKEISKELVVTPYHMRDEKSIIASGTEQETPMFEKPEAVLENLHVINTFP